MKTILTLHAFLLTCSIAVAQIKPTQPDFDKLPVAQWRFKIRAPILSTPVVSDGVVYFGGLDSTLYALDLATGQQKWKLRTNGELRSTVAVANGKIYLLGGNGVLSCIDKNTGKRLWTWLFDNSALFISERKYDFADYYHSSPIVYNNVVYFGSAAGKVHALKAENGEPIWSFSAGDIIHNTPVIYKDKLYFGSFDGYLYGLNAANGTLVWKFKSIGQKYFPKGEMQGSPTAGHDMIFIGGRDYNTYAIDANSGTGSWNRKFQFGWALSSTLQDTVLYVGTSDDRLLLALDARNGRELWKTDVKFNIFGSCAFSPNMVYVGTTWGKLYGLDRKTGNIKWGFDADGFSANHDLYFKADHSFRNDIGSILKSPSEFVAAEFKMGGIFSTPVVANDWIVITTTEGIVYGLKRG